MIRTATSADAGALLEIYAPYVTTPVTFEEEAPTEADFRQRIQKSHVWIVDESEGRLTGYAYASRHRERAGYRWSVESSVYVHPEFQRCGLGRALYKKLFATLRERTFLNVYAGIALPNEASVALHESMGFEPVGVYRAVGFKRGRWIDVGWWSLRLRDLPANPEEPRRG